MRFYQANFHANQRDFLVGIMKVLVVVVGMAEETPLISIEVVPGPGPNPGFDE